MNTLKLAALTLVTALVIPPAVAQRTEVKGRLESETKQRNSSAVAIGKNNVAIYSAGVIKGDTTVQGRTKIKAEQKNTASVAIGKNNSAANEPGVIGER